MSATKDTINDGEHLDNKPSSLSFRYLNKATLGGCQGKADFFWKDFDVGVTKNIENLTFSLLTESRDS